MLYKKEFGDNFNLGFNIGEFPELHDKSYHNDVCPSFWFMKNGQYIVLWVDFENPQDRESDSKRYTISTARILVKLIIQRLVYQMRALRFLELKIKTIYLRFLTT